METIERLESEVRGYCRNWPAVFDEAKGHVLRDVDGDEYLDFFAGAGVLNYGHNNPRLKEKLVDYITRDGITHSLDKITKAKIDFLNRFEEVILEPRGLAYKVQFPGPTGTNSVEAALKLARKVTGREHIVSFTNAFHGMTLGSLSVTGNSMKRRGAGVPLVNSTSMPYCGYLGDDNDSINYLDAYLSDSERGSGLDLPAAVIVETVQAEGGINVASHDWLRKLEGVCREHGVLLIVDDIQVGCGRTGPFFSFEESGITPDVVCLSKSLSGYGLPFAVTLIRPEFDVWEPGEHNGTFRGHNLAMVTATEALEAYWRDDGLTQEVERKAEIIRSALTDLAVRYPQAQATPRGRGLIQGLVCEVDGLAQKICQEAFERKMLLETSGPESEVVKLLPPLTIPDDELERGLAILDEAMDEALRQRGPVREVALAGL